MMGFLLFLFETGETGRDGAARREDASSVRLLKDFGPLLGRLPFRVEISRVSHTRDGEGRERETHAASMLPRKSMTGSEAASRRLGDGSRERALSLSFFASHADFLLVLACTAIGRKKVC